MKKIVLRDEEYELLQKLLRAVPPAQLPRLLPDWTGADMRYYRCLLTKVLHKDFSFPKTDDANFRPVKAYDYGDIFASIEEED